MVLTAAGCGRSPSTTAAPPTFARDIAPIVFRRCTPCHRPGQSAPFVLLTYEDVQSRAAKIARVTASRRMPPWLPDSALETHVGDRRLTDAELALIQRWVGDGAAEGDPRELIAPPVWPDGWQSGQPDLVVDMPKAFVLAAGDHDVFRNFVFPVALPTGKYVRTVEFRPGNAAVIHHAVISLDRSRGSRRRDGRDGTPGYDGMIAQGAQSPDGHFLGWTPGRGPIESPAAMPWRLDPGSDLVVQLHLLPGKTRQTVQPTIGLFFTDRPPERTPVMIKLGSKTIEIPAGERRYEITDSYVLPVDVDVLSVYPHAHYLGDEMTADAVLPGGETRSLLHIPHWNFHWQQDYRFRTPIALPRGTTLRMRYTYDNSGQNAHNPHHPPAIALYGPESNDEMGDFWLQVLARSDADATVLARAFQQRESVANVAGGEMLVRRKPADAASRVFLGTSYLDVGRTGDAIVQLERAVALDGTSADAHNALGGALMQMGRSAEGMAHLSRAAALDPSDDRLHVNFANALNAVGRTADAARELARALAVNPDFAEAHNNLGVLLNARGDVAAAIGHLARAVAIKPDYADAHNNLAVAFAGAGRLGDATREVRQALASDPAHAGARRNLELLMEMEAR